MYQLGLSAATAEVPRMSLTLGANRWASRVVVVLQLAAWSAVGIVLLQKGVSSLQKTSDARNATKTNYTELIANLAMNKIPDEGEVEEFDTEMFQILATTEVGWQEDGKADKIRDVDIDMDSSARVDGISSLTESTQVIHPLPQPTSNHVLPEGSKKMSWHSERNKFHVFPKFPLPSKVLDDLEEAEDSTTSLPSTAITEKYNVRESRRKVKLPHLSGGGAAAAAVAMVAVGAVMLVLGPAVIILRALDERRQERRFLKLSGQDDLPPSYEQATLMDEAPRYSTLSLNTIIACAPGAGPSSSDVSPDTGSVREV